MNRDNCDNFFYEILHVMKVRLKESHTKKVTVLETMFDEMLQRYDATCHRLSHLIQGLLDVNAKILEYGDSSHQRPESDLLKQLLLKLKVWYRSVPKEQETALSDEWSSFVKQLAFVGTRNDHKIDDMYKPAMLELHALLQLAVDLEAEHESTVTLPLKPPIYFTVDYSGISDEPSQQDADQVMVTDHQSSSHETGLPPHPPNETEHLFKVAGASGRTYTFTNEGPSPRPPPYERGRSFSRGRGGFGRGQQWNQQLSYYSAESSRGGVVRSLDLRLLIARAIVVETSRKPSSVIVIVDSTPTRNRTTCQGKMPRLVVERRLDKHLVRQCQPYHLYINVRNGCRNRRGRL